MKSLNTTFRNFSLALGFLFVGFFSNAQNYEPLVSASSFVNGNTTANPNTGTDLWFDFGWRRSSDNISFNSNSITFPRQSTSTTISTVDFALTPANTISFTITPENNGNTDRRLDINVRSFANNTVARTFVLTQSTTPNLRSGTINYSLDLTGLTPSNYYVEFVFTSNNTTLNFSNFSTDATPSILPVTYASLSAKPLTNAVQIEWATTNEVNNSHFEVERTNDGENWTTIGTVEGNGNTFSVTNYEFVDNTPAQGANIYRLKQVDWNGDFVYSVAKTVVWGGEIAKNNVQVYPNPSANVIHITGVDNPKVTIYNMAGSVMIQSSNTNSLDLQELLKGVYFIHVQNPAGEVSRIRFIKE